MKPIFCIVGKTGAGKSTLYDVLTTLDPFNYKLNLKGLVYSTTRPPRENETDGKDYNFKSKEEFLEEYNAGNIIEMRDYNTNNNGNIKYYTTRKELNINDCDAIICASSVDQAIIYATNSYPVYFIIMNVAVATRMTRVLDRGNSDIECYELCRRILEESDEFNCIYNFANDDNSITITNKLDEDVIQINDYMFNVKELNKLYEFIYDKIAEQ